MTPPTPERKCSRQTIAETNQETMTGIWTESEVSPPETPKIITNTIQARKITEMKVTATSQEDMKKYGKAEEIVGTVPKEERRKIATPIRRNTRKQVQKGKKTQATIVGINENDDKEEEDSKEDVSDFEESKTEINLDNERKISSLYTENTSRQDVKPSTSHTENASGQEIKPSTSNSSTDSTDSSDEYEKPYNSITRAELMKDGSYYDIVNRIVNDMLNKMGPYTTLNPGKFDYTSLSEEWKEDDERSLTVEENVKKTKKLKKKKKAATIKKKTGRKVEKGVYNKAYYREMM